MSDYSLDSTFNNPLYNRAFGSVTARPAQPKTDTPLPLAFNGATLPNPNATPQPPTAGGTQAQLDAATSGADDKFMNQVLGDLGMANFSSPKATTETPPTGQNPGKFSKFAQGAASGGLIGGFMAMLGGDKKPDNPPAVTPSQDGSGSKSLNTATPAAYEPAGTASGGTATVSMNTVDGKPAPAGDAGSRDISFGVQQDPAVIAQEAKATAAGEEIYNQDQLDKINEQLAALDDPQKAKELLAGQGRGGSSAYFKAPDAPVTTNPDGSKSVTLDGFNGPQKIDITPKKPGTAAGTETPAAGTQHVETREEEDARMDREDREAEARRHQGLLPPDAGQAQQQQVRQELDAANGITASAGTDTSGGGGLFD